MARQSVPPAEKSPDRGRVRKLVGGGEKGRDKRLKTGKELGKQHQSSRKAMSSPRLVGTFRHVGTFSKAANRVFVVWDGGAALPGRLKVNEWVGGVSTSRGQFLLWIDLINRNNYQKDGGLTEVEQLMDSSRLYKGVELSQMSWANFSPPPQVKTGRCVQLLLKKQSHQSSLARCCLLQYYSPVWIWAGGLSKIA